MQGMGFLTPEHLGELQTPLADVWIHLGSSAHSELRPLVDSKKPFFYLWRDSLDRPQIHAFEEGVLHPVQQARGDLQYAGWDKYELGIGAAILETDTYDVALVKKSPFNYVNGAAAGDNSTGSGVSAANVTASVEPSPWLPYRNFRMQVVLEEANSSNYFGDPRLASHSYVLSIDNMQQQTESKVAYDWHYDSW